MPKQSDLRRAFAEDGERRTHIGGQALIEGVMMRGKLNWAVAVREPDGNMHTEEHPLSKKGNRPKWFDWPLVRGCVALVDSLVLGFKALEIAANHAYAEEDEEGEGVAAESSSEARDAAIGEPAKASAADDAASDFAAAAAEAAATVTPAAATTSPAGAAAAVGPAAEVAATAAPAVTAAGAAAEQPSTEEERPFSWRYDFGRPDTVIDALGAQTKLEVVTEPAVAGESDSVPVAAADAKAADEAIAEPGQGLADAEAAATEQSTTEEEPFFGKGEMAISMVLGIVLGVGLFIFLPALASNLLVGEYEQSPLAWNIVDGIMRVAIFVFYVWLIGRMKDIKRMFSYHGAEHKTIHCYEHGLELTPQNARQFPCLHVRCGTAFLIMVMIVAILVYTIIPLNLLIASWGISGPAAFALLIAVRILFMPLIAGISYEITVKWAGSRPNNPLVRVVLWPGMQMQRLTTNEPDDSMLECAIQAMKLVVEREQAAAEKAATQRRAEEEQLEA